MVPSRVVVLNDSCRARGGATSIALLATRLLRARGHEVIFVTGDDGRNPALEEIGVRMVALGGKPLLQLTGKQAVMTGLWNGAGTAFLKDWIRREGRPGDVWHLHNWSQIRSPSVFSGLSAIGDRLVVHAHDYFNACPNGAFWNYASSQSCRLKPLSAGCILSNCDRRSYSQKLWRLARHSMLGRTFRKPDAPRLLLIHPEMSGPMQRAGMRPERMIVLRNPVTPWLKTPIDPGPNRGFLFVGRLDAEKGALQLAQAAARTGVAVTFIGEGPQKEEIAAVCPHALMTGWQDHQGIIRHAEQARALVMPSRYPEPFGLAAVEALGSGLPVIASHTALLAGEIEERGVGWAVDCRDGAAMADCLRQVDEMAEGEISAMGARAVLAAAEIGLTPQAWCDGLEEIYANCLRVKKAA